MCTVATGGSVRTLSVQIRYRQGIDLTSRKRCLHCIASRKRRIKRTSKIGRKAPPHGGNGKLSGGIPHLRHHRDDGLDPDRTGKPEKSVKRPFMCGMSLTKNLMQNYSDHFGNSQRSSPSPTGCVKSTSPVTENHYKNGYVNYIFYKNFIMTNVDNNRDTKYTIDNDTNNHNAHNLHE